MRLTEAQSRKIPCTQAGQPKNSHVNFFPQASNNFHRFFATISLTPNFRTFTFRIRLNREASRLYGSLGGRESLTTNAI